MVYKGEKRQKVAMEECKALNAQLPIPKSKGELDKFVKIAGAGNSVWLGIRDFTESGVKSKWKDVEGNNIGNAYVNSRVINLIYYSLPIYDQTKREKTNKFDEFSLL